jgi:hypothetical protein
MHSAPHRNNSDFQLRHFIAGSCHTADGAWALLYNQLLDIQIKHEHTKAQIIRRKIKALEFEKRMVEAVDEIERLTVEADLIEFKSGEGLLELALAGAEKELETIKSLMDELEPQRQYAHLPLLEATEAAQRGEWLGEFKARIENYLLTQGTIPQDQLEAMRRHPDFEDGIVPHISNVLTSLTKAENKIDLLKNSPNLLLTSRGEKDAA